MEKGRGTRHDPWGTPVLKERERRKNQQSLRRSRQWSRRKSKNMASWNPREESISRRKECSAVSNASQCETSQLAKITASSAARI